MAESQSQDTPVEEIDQSTTGPEIASEGTSTAKVQPEVGNNTLAPAAADAAQPESADAAPASPFEPNAIKVVAKCESFRRAGRWFSRDVTTIRAADLSEAEFEQLLTEPMLSVQPIYLAEED
ncbi:hypothetical protein [Paludibacterium sp. B53371]|uniref:hypothetical protein n=1 Tax=Paludibacterium sp. B53371 TaxID=2806263 RepID=UPI001C03EF6E|nr:hypothetical protein [Paludibacterium sp. B53371]